MAGRTRRPLKRFDQRISVTPPDEPTAEHPLLLEELIEMVPEAVRLQLEVKAHADPTLARRTAEALCKRLRGAPIRDRIELISFHGEACAVAAADGISSRLVIWADYAPEALAVMGSPDRCGGISVEHFLLTERWSKYSGTPA